MTIQEKFSFEEARKNGILVDNEGNFENENHQKAFALFIKKGKLSYEQRIHLGILANPKLEESLIDDLNLAKELLKREGIIYQIMEDLVLQDEKIRTTPFHFKKISNCEKGFHLLQKAGLNLTRQSGDDCSFWLYKRPDNYRKDKKMHPFSAFITKEMKIRSRKEGEEKFYFLHSLGKKKILLLSKEQNENSATLDERSKKVDELVERLAENFPNYTFSKTKKFTISYLAKGANHQDSSIAKEAKEANKANETVSAKDEKIQQSLLETFSKEQWMILIAMIPKEFLQKADEQSALEKIERIRKEYLLIPKDHGIAKFVQKEFTKEVDEI